MPNLFEIAILKQHLIDRGMAQMTVGAQYLAQLFSRQMLMGMELERGFPDLPEQLPKRGVPGKICTHGQNGNETTNETGQLGLAATRRNGAYGYVILSRVSIEERLEGGHQYHEERNILVPGQVFQSTCQGERDGE
jgi:hypothetical protein